MSLSKLQTRALREIVVHARPQNLGVGKHLAESLLAQLVGVSRFSISAALGHLNEMGVVRHDRNEGYFLHVPATDLGSVAQEWLDTAEDCVYLHVACARQSGQLAVEVNEADLMREFNMSRAVLCKVLLRIQQEGWIELRAGFWQLISVFWTDKKLYFFSHIV